MPGARVKKGEPIADYISDSDMVVVYPGYLQKLEEEDNYSFIAASAERVRTVDEKGYSQEVYDRICAEFAEFAAKLEVTDLTFIPVSALKGDMAIAGAWLVVARAAAAGLRVRWRRRSPPSPSAPTAGRGSARAAACRVNPARISAAANRIGISWPRTRPSAAA